MMGQHHNGTVWICSMDNTFTAEVVLDGFFFFSVSGHFSYSFFLPSVCTLVLLVSLLLAILLLLPLAYTYFVWNKFDLHLWTSSMNTCHFRNIDFHNTEVDVLQSIESNRMNRNANSRISLIFHLYIEFVLNLIHLPC